MHRPILGFAISTGGIVVICTYILVSRDQTAFFSFSFGQEKKRVRSEYPQLLSKSRLWPGLILCTRLNAFLKYAWMGIKSAIDWVIEKIGFQPFSDEQANYDFVMFVLIVVNAYRINPGHNRDFENKCGYSNWTRPFFPRPNEKEEKKRSGHARVLTYIATTIKAIYNELANSRLARPHEILDK